MLEDIKKIKRSIALLMINESPVGLRYLEAMMQNGFVPTVIIIAYNPKLSQMAVETVKNRTNDSFHWKTKDEILQGSDVPVFFVDNHNSAFTHELLRRYNVDVAILGGTGIIKKETLSIPKIGTINVHPGLLPNYRGCSGVEWALYNNDVVGVTCHFVTEEIDAGEIIHQFELNIVRGDIYSDVRRKAYEAQPLALIESLKKLIDINYKNNLLSNTNGDYYKPIPEDKLQIAKDYLTNNTYKHYKNMNQVVIRTAKGERKIGEGQSCFIIAEVSANHNQSYEKAVEIVKAAAYAGADAVKIQTYTPDMMTIDSDKRYFMVGDMIGSADNPDAWKGMSLYKLYQKAFTPLEWHKDLKKLTEDFGMVFFSTPYEETGVDFLESVGVDLYKVASYETTHIPFLKRVAQTGKPVIMSVGFSTLEEIELAVKTLRENGAKDIILLHCTTAYSKVPKYEDANLNTMLDLQKRFGVVTGFSDNNAGIDIPLQAVMMGASVIEKHIVASVDDNVIDGDFSVGPEEFRKLVQAVRRAEKARGQVRYGFKNQSEKNNAKYQRSIFVTKDIKAGEKISKENIRVIRPNLGLQPKYYEEIIGRTVKTDIERGEPLTFDVIL